MRASEKMLANAKRFKLVPYTRDDGHGARCALGLMAEDTMAEYAYPWLNNLVPDDKRACTCTKEQDGNLLPSYGVSGWVAHLFNEHVMQGGRRCPGAEKWTLEQLAEWLDTVDPTPREVEDLCTLSTAPTASPSNASSPAPMVGAMREVLERGPASGTWPSIPTTAGHTFASLTQPTAVTVEKP